MEKVSLQINLERNPSNFSYIFLLDVKFENSNSWIACSYYIIHACKISRK